MKKLSLLVALILCITVGGVYATWTYSRNTVDSKQATATTVITGTASSAKGVISVDSHPARVIVDDTDGNYVAELWYGELDADSKPLAGADQVGEIKVTFAAYQGADESVTNNGIVLAWTVSANTLGEYDIDGDGNKDPIFVINQPSGTFNGGNPTQGETLNLNDCIALNVVNGKSITLDTYAEYQAFEAAITGITFTVTISEKV